MNNNASQHKHKHMVIVYWYSAVQGKATNAFSTGLILLNKYTSKHLTKETKICNSKQVHMKSPSSPERATRNLGRV